MSDHTKSFLRVFISAFIVTICASVGSAGSISWNTDFWMPLFIAGVSTGIRAAIASEPTI